MLHTPNLDEWKARPVREDRKVLYRFQLCVSSHPLLKEIPPKAESIADSYKGDVTFIVEINQ